MEPHIVEGHGLLLPGHATTPSAARAAAREWLLAAGVSAWDAEAGTEGAQVARAWWGGELGFVQEHHDQAAAVTVVHLPPEAMP